jgi:hypothetical protein
MGRFIFWTFIFIIAGGLLIHYNVYLPYLSDWIGNLPGDSIIKIKGRVVYFPIASGALASLAYCVIITVLTKK